MSEGSLRPPTKLLFVILAHDRPEDAAGLARTLVAAASDARALIHFDARAPEAVFAALAAAVADAPRVGLVAKRVACRWGGFGLVEAPLNALAQAEAEAAARGWAPDYAILLSGACLPCRPVASLERFLAENAWREFIESEDETWITGGWRAERWRLWHVFDHKTQNLAEHLSARLQKALGVRRRFPKGLAPRFGSQWWALTWPVCQAILADVRRDPKRLGFFRTVWIPDEMLFQTYVHALVPKEAIAGFGLTHFQFTNLGKPVVFHDDHDGYVRSLERFFVRKASPEATALRAACLARAAEPDDGAPFTGVGARRRHYPLKDLGADPLPSAGRAVLPRPVHRPDRSGARHGRDTLHRARRSSRHRPAPRGAAARAPVRDPRRALRARADRPRPRPRRARRAAPPRHRDPRRPPGALAGPGPRPGPRPARRGGRAGHPLVAGGPGELLAAVVRDPAALVVTLPPLTGDPGRDRAALIRACLGPVRRRTAGLPFGVPPASMARAAFEAGGGAPGPDIALWMIGGLSPPPTRGVPMLPPPGFPRTGFPEWFGSGAPMPPPDLVLPWGGDQGPAARDRRRRERAAAFAACRFREAAWFPAFTTALDVDPAQEQDPEQGADPAAARELVR